MRKLVTVRTIENVAPIDGADMIVRCDVDGWTVVSKKGEFEAGDQCLFFEIDSFLPADDPRFEFLKKTGVKTDPSGAERIRLKTVKLRKQLSQGLALPLDQFPEVVPEQDVDFSELLNVIKYERPEPKAANAAGTRPDYFPKTDEDRIQNLYNKYDREYSDEWFIPTLKLDGSSCTVAFIGQDMKHAWNYKHDVPEGEEPKCLPWITTWGEKMGEVVYCSRNMQLKRDTNSHFYKAVMNGELFDKIRSIAIGKFDDGSSIAIQGEVCGPGIQGNNEKLNDYQFFAFNLYDITQQKYLLYDEARRIFTDHRVQMVPTLGSPTQVFQRFANLRELLNYADGPSLNGKRREGVVFKPAYREDISSFKVISNDWLLKGGDD